METGLIFDIQGYSVHDGPGCRTLVFLNGCTMQCRWCANPEGQLLRPRLMFREQKCVHKHYLCAQACSCNAIRKDSFPQFDHSLCTQCDDMECVDACLHEALKIAGQIVTLAELMRILQRDQSYWGSDGGVTFTGGEPLVQSEFLIAALKQCRHNYIHTAVETSAHVDTAVLLHAQEWTDWMFVDLKHMDSEAHRLGTGVGNELVLKNIKAAASSDTESRLIIRIPVIPDYNDSTENMQASADFINQCGLQEVNLLSFHHLGKSKYEQLGIDYSFSDRPTPTVEKMQSISDIFKQSGIRCYIDAQTPF